jgi:hypothetical protein
MKGISSDSSPQYLHTHAAHTATFLNLDMAYSVPTWAVVETGLAQGSRVRLG